MSITSDTYGGEKMLTRFWLGNLTKKRPLRKPGLRWEINKKKKIGYSWTGLIWL
jgi:hypothetical protein